jgi:hypothetical protein
VRRVHWSISFKLRTAYGDPEQQYLADVLTENLTT